MGAVCALGHDCDDLLDAIRLGRSGIAPVRRFDTTPFTSHLGAEVPSWTDGTYEAGLRASDICRDFSVRAASEALARAGLARGDLPPERVGFAFGSGLVDGSGPLHDLAAAIADALGIAGPRVAVSTACSSSTGAVGVARDLLGMNAADVMVAGGADVLSPSVFAGFHALGVLSPGPCAPFSFPIGTTLGEGAGFLVLERARDAAARSANVEVRLGGYGLSADAYHETSPDPEGRGVTRAVRAALADAGVGPSAVGYVNAHGSGTQANDPSENAGICRVMGDIAVPVSSTKGALGHAQGAAGVLESIVTILGMRHEFLAPTLNYVGSRKSAPNDPVGQSKPRAQRVTAALCLNSAFGGANAALLFTRGVPSRKPRTPRRPVEVVGMGLADHGGLRGGELGRPAPRPHMGPVPSFTLEELAPRTDPRGLDRSARLLIAAAALALRDSGIRLRGSARDAAGMISATVRPSPESVAAFGDSVANRGLLGLSAAAFARIVLNASAGFCSKELGLRGPLTTVTSGAGSGLLAVVLAAEMLSTRSEVGLMLATAVDEMGTDDAVDSMAEGAIAIALAEGTRPQSPGHGGHSVRLTGWGVAAAGRLDTAIEGAACMEGRSGDPFARTFRESDYALAPERGWTVPSALAFWDAVVCLREEPGQRALVAADIGPALCAAAILCS